MTGVGGLAAAGAVVRAILRWSALAMSPWIASHAITESASAGAQDAGVAQLEEAFRAQGIHLDVARGLCSIKCVVDVRDDLLEYLIVNFHGAAHESLFATEVVGSQLNAALLALGAEQGRNARWFKVNPQPTPDEARAGAPMFTVESPDGDGVYMYVAWKADGETYFYRVEDLLRNLASGRSMQRHRWVFLGSRMVRVRASDAEQAFAADLEGNLVNISFFEQGNTLITCSLPECLSQSIWLPNAWLLPPRDSAVELIFSHERLGVPSAELEARFPVLEPEPKPADGAGDGR
jgi:hypothetical protein